MPIFLMYFTPDTSIVKLLTSSQVQVEETVTKYIEETKNKLLKFVIIQIGYLFYNMLSLVGSLIINNYYDLYTL